MTGDKAALSTGLAARNYLIEEYTKTVCPECVAVRAPRSDEPGLFKDGMLVSHDGRIWMHRFCEKHGETESLYEEDAEIWRARHGWSTPTTSITPDRPGNYGPFPEGYRTGLPVSHGQHTCILLLNVTDRCNYGCPTCYASAQAPGAPAPELARPTLDDILLTVNTIIRREGGKLGVLMLSGGEPTVREDLTEMLERLVELNITRIMINTNGRRIARDDRFLDFLRRHRRKVEVYLQFDGLRESTFRILRGEDVSREKREALSRLNEARVFTTLVMTVARGVNDDEVGEVVRLGMNTPRCAGLAIQPMFGSGRVIGYDPKNRVTPTGVLRRLGAQTAGVVQWTDFIPLPCSHKDCCDISYFIKTADGAWKSLPTLIGKDELKKWIHLVANTITFDTLAEPVAEMLKSGSIQRVFSEQMRVGTPQLMMDIAQLCACVPGLPQAVGGLWTLIHRNGTQSPAALELAAERTFRITTKMFMDAHRFHEARIRQCCVHSGTFEQDPRRFSFCWRWMFADATDFPDDATIGLGGASQ